MFVDAAAGDAVDAGKWFLAAVFSSGNVVFEGAGVDFFAWAGALGLALLGEGVGEPANGIAAAQVAFDDEEVAAGSEDGAGVGAVVAGIHADEDGVCRFEFFEELEVAF